jgi:hypothetical protein
MDDVTQGHYKVLLPKLGPRRFVGHAKHSELVELSVLAQEQQHSARANDGAQKRLSSCDES